MNRLKTPDFQWGKDGVTVIPLRMRKLEADVSGNGSAVLFHSTWNDGRHLLVEYSMAELSLVLSELAMVDRVMRARMSGQVDKGMSTLAGLLNGGAAQVKTHDVILDQFTGDRLLLIGFDDRCPIGFRLNPQQAAGLSSRLESAGRRWN